MPARVIAGRGPRRLPPSGFLADRRGATAVEYALLAAVVAIFAIGGLQTFAGSTGALYTTLESIVLAMAAAGP